VKDPDYCMEDFFEYLGLNPVTS